MKNDFIEKELRFERASTTRTKLSPKVKKVIPAQRETDLSIPFWD